MDTASLRNQQKAIASQSKRTSWILELLIMIMRDFAFWPRVGSGGYRTPPVFDDMQDQTEYCDMASYKRTIERFARDQRGAIAIAFACVSLAIMICSGAGVDYARAARVKNVLSAAADSAVLAGVVADESMSVADRKAYVSTWFQAQSKEGFASAVSFKIGVTAPPAGRGVTVELGFEAQVPTTFMNLVGVQTMTVVSKATASREFPPYTDVLVALDVSQSMALAATQADIDRMVDLTKGGDVMPKKKLGCAFACHAMIYGEKIPLSDIAKSNNISLRIDSLRTATEAVLDAAKAQQGSMKLFRFAVYTFRTKLTNVHALDEDLAAVKTDVTSKVKLLKPIDVDKGETNFDPVAADFASDVGISGDGSKSKPRKIAFIITDGVEDSAKIWNHTVTTFNPQHCDKMKKRDVLVAVIYTTYLAMPGDPDYDGLVSPIASDIGPNLQKCASPGLFFEAKDGPAIQSGMMLLFDRATQSARLTN